MPRAPPATTTPSAHVLPHVFWMVGLLALDGRQYVYRVYAPREALPADLFWAAFHCHEEDGAPRASDSFDAAEIWWIGGGTGPTAAELTVHRS